MGTSDSEGPAWQKFWMSMETGDTESMMSGEDGSHSRAPQTPGDIRSGMISPDLHRPDTGNLDNSVLPGDSASHHGDDVSAFVGAVEDTPFTFKFKAPGGRVHRLAVTASAGLHELITVIADKLGSEVDALGGVPTFEDGKMGHAGFALSYMDNEGDTVSLTTDHDLLEAISLARAARREKVDLFVHDPAKPAIPPTTEPQTLNTVPPTPPESTLRKRRGLEDEEVQSPSVERRNRKATEEAKESGDQIVPGVPNDLLLPGALVVLGAAIVVTFAIGRASSNR